MLDPTTDPDYSSIPVITLDSIARYVEKGIPTGDFLRAVITNDLYGACSRADQYNGKCLPQIVKYFYNQTPSGCWGSPDRHEKWLKHDGLAGVRRPQ